MNAPTRNAATRALDDLAAFGKAGDLSDSAVKLIGASFAAASLGPNPESLHWTDCAERPV